jgi:acetylglutamate kinase
MAIHDDRGPLLIEAADWIARFRGQYVVVKLGGALMTPAVLGRIAPQIAVMHKVGLRPVLVHGGGLQVDAACEARGVTFDKVGGRRVTSPAVMQVLLDVVAGDLNRMLVQALLDAGVPARGFAEGASKAVQVRKRPPTMVDGEAVSWGEVGDVLRVDEELLIEEEALPTRHHDPAQSIARGSSWVIPVLASVGHDDETWLNCNADSVAARAAIDLDAAKLVLLSLVRGVMQDPDAAGPISRLSAARARGLVDSGVAKGGMKAKLEEALNAVAGGVPRVHLLAGGEPMALLRELFTDDGCGTLVVG